MYDKEYYSSCKLFFIKSMLDLKYALIAQDLIWFFTQKKHSLDECGASFILKFY